jgi:hypothetical protein
MECFISGRRKASLGWQNWPEYRRGIDTGESYREKPSPRTREKRGDWSQTCSPNSYKEHLWKCWRLCVIVPVTFWSVRSIYRSAWCCPINRFVNWQPIYFLSGYQDTWQYIRMSFGALRVWSFRTPSHLSQELHKTNIVMVYLIIQYDSLARKLKYSSITFKVCMVPCENLHGRSLGLSKQNHHTPQRNGLHPWRWEATAKQEFDSVYSYCVCCKHVLTWTACVYCSWILANGFI